MKNVIFTILFTTFTSAFVYSQAGIYLYLPNITTSAGTGVHIDESLLSSFQFGTGVAVSQGPPPSAGQPSISDITVSKGFDLASLRLQALLLKGTSSPYAEFRFYNSQSVLLFSVRSEGVFVSVASESSSDGCPSGCQDIAESYSFAATSKVIQRNLAVTPNQVLTFDILTNKATLTQ